MEGSETPWSIPRALRNFRLWVASEQWVYRTDGILTIYSQMCIGRWTGINNLPTCSCRFGWCSRQILGLWPYHVWCPPSYFLSLYEKNILKLVQVTGCHKTSQRDIISHSCDINATPIFLAAIRWMLLLRCYRIMNTPGTRGWWRAPQYFLYLSYDIIPFVSPSRDWLLLYWAMTHILNK